MAALLIKNIHTLVTCDDRDRVLHRVDILCRDGWIREIGPELQAPDAQILDASGLLGYPGLINTHHHLYQIFSRNLPAVQRLELFDWLTSLYGIWQHLDGETLYYASLVGLGELMKNGCTTCFDHHYVFPAGSGDLLGKQLLAAQTLGIRMEVSRGSMDLSQKDGGLPPDSVVQTVTEIMEDSDRLISRYHDPAPGSMARVSLAPCSPFSASADLLRESARLARSHKVRLHTHLCETKDEERYTLEKYGLRPLAYLASLGWEGPDIWFAHGIHFETAELQRLAETGAGVAHCPVSNMKLSSGVARIPEMLELGVKVGLGVDGSASNDGSNLLEELRVSYLLHRLHASAQAPTGYQLLQIATRGGAALLGRPELGAVAVGQCADLFFLRRNRLELVGADLDPKNLLGTVGLNGPVDYTVVQGKVTVDQGRLTQLDEDALSTDASAACLRYWERAGIIRHCSPNCMDPL